MRPKEFDLPKVNYEPLSYAMVLAACGNNEEAAQEIWKRNRPCITMVREVVGAVVQDKEQSYLLGAPFLPRDFEWPKDPDGLELVFLAHVALASLPRNDLTAVLPKDGYLQFFGSQRVATGEGTEYGVIKYHGPDLEIALSGEGMGLDYPACKLHPVEDFSLPALTWFDYSIWGFDVEEGISDLLYRRDTLVNRLAGEVIVPMHQMFGHLDDPQGMGDDDEHAFVLQIASDFEIDLSWLDAGTVFFRMDHDSLKAHRWDAAQMFVSTA